MARSIWKGVVSFGLVSVPVAMYSATREHEVPFHQFEKGTGDRIRYQRVNERTGEEVEYEDIVKGADTGGGDFVMVEPDELEEIAPGQSRSLDIHQFVDLDEVDPIYFQKTYYLGPGAEETMKPYVLLRDSLAEANRAAIGTLVMRGKEYLAAIRADDQLLVLETMFFADEIRQPKDVVDPMPGSAKPRPQELRMAEQLIESMTAPWHPDDFRDSYTDRVKDLIAAKLAGDEVTVAEPAPDATGSKDLMEALRRSVEEARRRRGGGGSGGDGGTAKAGRADRAGGGKKAAAKSAGAAAAKETTAKKAAKATTKVTTKAKKAAADKPTKATKAAAGKKAPATKAAGKKVPATKAPAKKAPAKKAPAKKAAGKKAPAKKAAGNRAPGKKAGGRKASGKDAPANVAKNSSKAATQSVSVATHKESRKTGAKMTSRTARKAA